MEAWTLSNRGSRLYALLHEARVRREIEGEMERREWEGRKGENMK